MRLFVETVNLAETAVYNLDDVTVSRITGSFAEQAEQILDLAQKDLVIVDGVGTGLPLFEEIQDRGALVRANVRKLLAYKL